MKARKVITFMLGAMMALAPAIPVMAEDSSADGLDTADENQEINVPVTLDQEESEKPDTVYKAVIAWSAGSITGAVKPQKYHWDADATKYVRDDDGESNHLDTTKGKLSTDVKIKVTNKSNASVYYKIEETDLNDAYTLSHTNAAGVGSTEITSADLAVLSDGTTAYENMMAGSKDDAALTGSGVESEEYVDTVTLTGTTLNESTSATNVAKYTVTVSKDPMENTKTGPEVTAFTYTMSNGTVLSAEDLLNSETAAFVNPDTNETETVYNGYLSKTSGATYNDAIEFINELNANTASNGTWKLLTSANEAKAWAPTIGLMFAPNRDDYRADDGSIDIEAYFEAEERVTMNNNEIYTSLNVGQLRTANNGTYYALGNTDWWNCSVDISTYGTPGFNVIWVAAD